MRRMGTHHRAEIWQALKDGAASPFFPTRLFLYSEDLEAAKYAISSIRIPLNAFQLHKIMKQYLKYGG
jgi:hypothetical protein